MALKSEALFAKMTPFLATQGADLVKKVGATYHFELRANKDSAPKKFTLNLKSGNGSFSEGAVGKADATFIMLDDNLIALAKGQLNP